MTFGWLVATRETEKRRAQNLSRMRRSLEEAEQAAKWSLEALQVTEQLTPLLRRVEGELAESSWLLSRLDQWVFHGEQAIAKEVTSHLDTLAKQDSVSPKVPALLRELRVRPSDVARLHANGDINASGPELEFLYLTLRAAGTDLEDAVCERALTGLRAFWAASSLLNFGGVKS